MNSEFINVLKTDGINAKGFGKISKMAMIDRRLTLPSKAIYGYICAFAGSDDIAYPSIDKICNDLNISKKDTFRKHLKYLIQYGYIILHKTKDGSGKFGRNEYEIATNPVELKQEVKLKDIVFKVVERIKPKSKKTITQKNHNPKKASPENVPTTINSVLKRTEKHTNNTTTKEAVVENLDSNSLDTKSKELIEKIKKIVDPSFKFESAKDFILKQGVDKINKYLDAWDKFKDKVKTSAIGYLKFIVQNNTEIPTVAINTYNGYNQYASFPQALNFKQRNYTQEDLEGFYWNPEVQN